MLREFFVKSVFFFSSFLLGISFLSQGQVVINEVLSSNDSTLADFQNTYNDWVELYNMGETPIELEGYGVSDDSKDPFQWLFPAVTLPAKGYLIVFASDKNVELDGELHTNFKLSASGENVYLTAPSGVLLDKSNTPTLLTDQSWGRVTDGAEDWRIFIHPTPGVSNEIGTYTTGKLAKAVVSKSPGFYSESISIELTCVDTDAVPYYSLDGDFPTNLFTENIIIENSRVLKTVCASDSNSSDVKTDSYFIGQTHDIPVVSLSFRPDDFYAIDSGIYVLGDEYESANPQWGANFWEDWERDIHMEYFVDEQEAFEQDLGVKIMGGWSRARDMKSLRLIARKEYGKDKINYPFFESKPYLEEFDQLVLRNSGNDFSKTMWRDAVNHITLSEISDVDLMAYQPVAVYFNGVYMGLHNMRERSNPEYIGYNRDIAHKSVNFLELNGGIDLPTADLPLSNSELSGQIKQGDNMSFVALYDTIVANDMTDSAMYVYVGSQLDLSGMIDYFSAQVYHINWDWPHNNIRFWNSAEFDGKWRYIYYDTEFGQGLYNRLNTRANHYELDRVIHDDRNVHSIMFKKLLENDEFKYQFINRSADFMNTIYLPENYGGIADSVEQMISKEIVNHAALYGGDHEEEVVRYKDFVNERPAYARGDFASQFSVSENTITLDVSPQGAGVIKISTIIPENYPWEGVYYNGVPVEVTAIANQGYAFVGWQENAEDASFVMELIGESTALTANFSPTTSFADLIITEINYHSQAAILESGDWFELYNNGTKTLDLGGWVFKDEHQAHKFVFAENTLLEAGGYLIVARDVVAFNSKYPEVTNVVGPIDFGLGNGGDLLTIKDNYGITRVHLEYKDDGDWPSLADGKGATLELKGTNLDYTIAQNWQAECKDGSPGKATQSCGCEFEIDLGEDVVACREVSELLSSGLETTGKNFMWYSNGDLVSIQSDYLATNLEEYTLVVTEGNCMVSGSVDVIGALNVDLGEDKHFCEERVLHLTSNLPSYISHSWFRNGVEVSDSNGLYVNTFGVYGLEVSHEDCPSYFDQIKITTSGDVNPLDDDFCNEDSTTIAVIEGKGNYSWHTAAVGGDSLGNGNVFSIAGLVSDTTFYIQDNSYSSRTLGVAESSLERGEEPFEEGMTFEVYDNLKLKAVSVNVERRYDFQEMTIDFVLTDSSENVLKTVHSVFLVDGVYRIEWDVQLEPGVYKMIAKAGLNNIFGDNLAYESVGGYPYQIDGLLSLIGTETGATNRYNYFYNWEIETGEQGCSRAPLNLRSLDCLVNQVEDEKMLVSLHAFPNPVEDKLYFSDNVGRVEVLTINGTLLLSANNVSSGLDLSDFQNGVYLVRLSSENKAAVQRIEIMR